MKLKFEWDENKNQLNIKKHNVRFEVAKEIFKKPVITFIDDRFDYGETRKVSYGELSDATVLYVVYTERKNKHRIISARKAKRKERKIYYEHITKKRD